MATVALPCDEGKISSADNPLLAGALTYASKGWSVIPLHTPVFHGCSCGKPNCGSPGKHPRTRNGLKEATKSTHEIQSWWEQWPDANIGILTGPESGICVLDVDGEEGLQALMELTANHDLPKTLTVLTGRKDAHGNRKGHHLYFRLPAGESVRNSTGRLGKGLDVRGTGGYVVAPPSVHASGHRYESASPGAELAEIPGWIFQELNAAKPMLVTSERTANAIPPGQRNITLASLAGTMRKRGMSPESIEAALLAENRAQCSPPLPESEVREIARSIGRYAADSATPRSGKSLRPWPSPLTDDAYHGLAGAFVRLVEPGTEADPAALLFSFLVAIGSLLGRRPHYLAGADKHSVNMFAVIVANSSKGRKGTSWGEIKRFCEFVDPEWAKARIAGGLTSGEGLIDAVRDPLIQTVPIKEKGRIVGYEEQQTDAGVTDKRLLCVEGELGQALQCAGREGNTLSPLVRLAWDGAPLRVLAKNAKATCAEPHISIIGHITSTELQRLLTSSDIANGFANRFLWVCAVRSKCLPFAMGVNAAKLSELAERTREAVAFARTVESVSWAENAKAEWARVYPELSEGQPGLLGSITARAEAQTIRLALLFALLDQVGEIRIEHLRAALELWRYSADSAAFVFGDGLGDPTADAIVRFLRENPEGKTRTELSDYFGRNKSSAEINNALAIAQSSGVIRSLLRETGGRRSEVWQLIGTQSAELLATGSTK